MGTKDGVDGKERGDINIHYSSCAISIKEKKKNRLRQIVRKHFNYDLRSINFDR